MFTQVTCLQVIRPTALSAAASCRRNVRHWRDQSDRRNTTAVDKFSYGYLVISGEELTALLSVRAVYEVATDTRTEICVGSGRVSSVSADTLKKRICKIQRAG